VTPDQLYARPPRIHTDGTGRVHGDWALSRESLGIIERLARPGDRTLETGAGLSTALLALLGADHTVVTPEVTEVRRLKAYCARHAIPTDRVRFEIGHSQDVLPVLAPGQLDLVVIDGSHSFPIPFLDWYFCAAHLREGGFVLIDDTQLWTGRVLQDFLAAESGWSHEYSPDRAAVFRKVKAFDRTVSWVDQPYVTDRSLAWHNGGWHQAGRRARPPRPPSQP
jgi:predicted O-methyltransferase YrrM